MLTELQYGVFLIRWIDVSAYLKREGAGGKTVR
jgi:hypothetical protein